MSCNEGAAGLHPAGCSALLLLFYQNGTTRYKLTPSKPHDYKNAQRYSQIECGSRARTIEKRPVSRIIGILTALVTLSNMALLD